MLKAVASRCTEYWSGVGLLRVLNPKVVILFETRRML